MNDDAQRVSTWKKLLLACAGVVAFVAPVAVGGLNAPPQTREMPPVASLPAFDVISVRVNKTPGPAGRGGGGLQPARYTAQNVSLRNIIKMAYGADRFPLFDPQVSGGPDWLASEKFDIEATAAGPTDRPQMQQMVQRMIAERFKLAAHFESRELPVYVLTKARADGKLGAGLTPTSDEACKAVANTPPMGPNMPLPGSPGSAPPPCGAVQFGPGVLIARGTPMGFFAQSLSNTPVVTGIDRMVLDRTGLAGNYGFDLRFNASPSRPASDAGAAAADERPSLFTALQEQLGLKLEATRAPVDVVVVDSAERPEEN